MMLDWNGYRDQIMATLGLVRSGMLTGKFDEALRRSDQAATMAAAVGPCAVSPTPSEGFSCAPTNSVAIWGTSLNRRMG